MAKNKGKNLKNKYDISLEEYMKMASDQEGACAICRKTPKVLNVDHNHTTGLVRGLLCPNCNHGLGKFKDSQELLIKAAKYLESHK